jgi:thioredoxin-dependent peroxiredoxin
MAEDSGAKASKRRHVERKTMAKDRAPREVSSRPEKTQNGPAVRTKAPAFRLPRDGGGMVALGDFAGRKLVLYFYPRADTSGCTLEAVDFSRLKAAFSRAGTEILGISADPVAALDRFKSKHKLSIALASDEAHKVLENYGVWRQKTLYGRKFMGTVRSTYLIGPDQRIARIWLKVSVAGHAQDVLDAAKMLG